MVGGKRFEDSIMYKRGDYGEHLVDEFLLSRGNHIYGPMAKGQAHPIDRTLMSKDKKTGKVSLALFDVKTISRRIKYPDQGISIDHYNAYKKLKEDTGLPVYIFFVDAKVGAIYYNEIEALEAPMEVSVGGRTVEYPLVCENFSAVGGSIIYFPIDNTKHVCDLTPEQIKKLEELSNYGYKKDMDNRIGVEYWRMERNDISNKSTGE